MDRYRYLRQWLALASVVAMTVGVLLLALNIYGVFQDIRRPQLGIDDHTQLRFVPDEVWSFSRSIEEINALSSLRSPDQIATAANQIVHQSLVHVDWPRVNPVEYRQLVPAWDNYFLYAIGKFSGLPQFERYHFSDYERSIERGIGICGDFAMVLSQVLTLYGIPSTIVSFDGHVVVEYIDEKGDPKILDPDFGVTLALGHSQLRNQVSRVKQVYLDAGYTPSEVDYLFDIYTKKYALFDNTYDFMTKRYVFERVSYWLKWLLPIGLVMFAMFGWWKLRASGRSSSRVAPP